MSTIRRDVKKKPWFGWMLFILTVGVVFMIGLFMTNILERRTEAQY